MVKSQASSGVIEVIRGFYGIEHSTSKAPWVSHRQKVVPGQVIETTVRIAQRRFLLKPCREMGHLFEYLVAHTATIYGVEVYAATLMSNHYKVVIHDVEGYHPYFFRDLNRTLAQVLNRTYGLEGAVFENKPRRTICETAEATFEAIARTIVGPVTAGLVSYEKEWPGFRTRVEDMGYRTIQKARPAQFFAAESSFPKHASLKVSFPKELLKLYKSKAKATEALHQRCAELSAKARQEMKRLSRKFHGRKKSLRINPLHRSKTFEVFHRPRKRVSELGLNKEAIEARREAWIQWNKDYDTSRALFLKREVGVLWPAGTWAMARHFGQRVAPPPRAAA